MKLSIAVKTQCLDEVLTRKDLRLEDKYDRNIRQCLMLAFPRPTPETPTPTAPLTYTSITNFAPLANVYREYVLIGYHRQAERVLFLRKKDNQPFWVSLQQLNPQDKRVIYEMAMTGNLHCLLNQILQRPHDDIHLRSKLIRTTPLFSYFLPVSQRHSFFHRLIGFLNDEDVLSLHTVEMLCRYEQPTQRQLTELACKAFRKQLVNIGNHLISLGASPASKIIYEFSDLFCKEVDDESESDAESEHDIDIEQNKKRLSETIQKVGDFLARGDIPQAEFDALFPILAEHLMKTVGNNFQNFVKEIIDEEENLEILQQTSMLALRFLAWIEEHLKDRRMKIKSKTIDLFIQGLVDEMQVDFLKLFARLDASTLSFTFNQARLPHYYSAVPVRPQQKREEVSCHVSGAYQKLAACARFDCQAISQRNLLKLKEQLGELRPEEREFYRLFSSLVPEINLRHFSSNDLNLIVHQSKALMSHDELQRSRVGHGGLTNEEDQRSGNTDFVFFSMGLGSRFARWHMLRQLPYYFLFPASLILSKQGWISLNDWAAFKSDGAHDLAVFGDVIRETTYHRSDEPFMRRKTYAFTLANAPGQKAEVQVDRLEEVFYGQDVFEGWFYSILKQLRAMEYLGAKFPAQFYELLKQDPRFAIGQVIDRFFEVEAKLPCRVDMVDCIGIYDKHGKAIQVTPADTQALPSVASTPQAFFAASSAAAGLMPAKRLSPTMPPSALLATSEADVSDAQAASDGADDMGRRQRMKMTAPGQG